MTTTRSITGIHRSEPTMEGAGVNLSRAFGFFQAPALDPFLLLDHFGSDDPRDYLSGFPWHPHRGIETVTYMIEGKVAHSDSIGNSGFIGSGDVQWMTAGSGIIHQEMPESYPGTMQGFQLWVNLPRDRKMMTPRYRDVPAATIPSLIPKEGAIIKVISGEFEGTRGPVTDLVVPVEYLDITLDTDTIFERDIPEGHTVFAFIFGGSITLKGEGGGPVKEGNLVQFSRSGMISVQGPPQGNGRFILVSGPPLNEPVAWRGPIVMNTDDELAVAFREYREGTFLRTGKHMDRRVTGRHFL